MTTYTNGGKMKEQRIAKLRSIFQINDMIVKSETLKKNNFCSKDIIGLVNNGYIQRVRPGYYIWSRSDEKIDDIVLANRIIHNSVVCLFSAAEIYDLSDIIPNSVYLAVLAVGKLPILPQYPPITLYKMSKNLFELGIVEVLYHDRRIRIYDRERIVCDFIRLRSKVGNDVAIGVLKNYLKDSANIQKLLEYAQIMRINKVVRTYLEAMT
jgi:predicted transcriptional regulator of viral defense system